MAPQLWASDTCPMFSTAHQVPLAASRSVLTVSSKEETIAATGLQLWSQRFSQSPSQHGSLCCPLWVIVGQVVTGANCSPS